MSSLRNIEMQEYYVNLFYSVFLHVMLLFIFLTIFFGQLYQKQKVKVYILKYIKALITQ